MSQLGAKIRDALHNQKKTQSWLANKVGVSDNAVTKWLKNGKISRANAKKVSDALGLSLDDLLSDAPGTSDSPSHQFVSLFGQLTEAQQGSLLLQLRKLVKENERVFDELQVKLGRRPVPAPVETAAPRGRRSAGTKS